MKRAHGLCPCIYSMWRWNIKQGTNINWLNICFDRSVDREHPDKQKNIIEWIRQILGAINEFWHTLSESGVWSVTLIEVLITFNPTPIRTNNFTPLHEYFLCLYSLQDWGDNLDWNDFRFRMGHKWTRTELDSNNTAKENILCCFIRQTVLDSTCRAFRYKRLDMVCFKNKCVVAPSLGLGINLLYLI